MMTKRDGSDGTVGKRALSDFMIYGFVNQFEADGDGYLYRKNMRQPAIKVTAAERDAFVETYRRQCRHLLVWTLLGTLIWCFLGIAAFMLTEGVIDGILIPVLMAGPVLLAGVIVFAAFRMSDAPRRILAGRPQHGEVRTLAEVRRLAVQRTPWPYFWLMLAICGAQLFQYSRRLDEDPANRLFAGLWGLALLFIFSRMLRKWRFDREQRSD